VYRWSDQHGRRGRDKRIILGQRDIVEKTATLIDTANRNGGTDNITVMLIEPFA